MKNIRTVSCMEYDAEVEARSRSLQSMHISRRETWQRLLDVAAQRLRLS